MHSDHPLAGLRGRARDAGLLRYFTGVPCKNGHVAERLTSTGQCFACNRMWQKRYADADRAVHNRKVRARYARNPEAGRALCARYYADNRDALLARKKAYNHENLARWRAIEAERVKTDQEYHIKRVLRSRITSATKRDTKTGSAIRDLGCSIAELKVDPAAKFRDGMTWDNWPKHWHIDHVRPLGLFDLTDFTQFAEACHYTNLQPLLVDEHRRKSWRDRKAVLANRDNLKGH